VGTSQSVPLAVLRYPGIIVVQYKPTSLCMSLVSSRFCVPLEVCLF